MVVTPRMMLVAQRSDEFAMASDQYRIDINALGFAGTLAAKNKESFDAMKVETPISLL